MKITRKHIEAIVGFCQGNDSESHPEQCGWITENQGAFETNNISDTPIQSCISDYTPSRGDIISFWHSHPGGMQYASLSSADIENADSNGWMMIAYHPQSDQFFWHDPTGLVDVSELESYSGSGALQPSSSGVFPTSISSELQSRIAAQSQENALALLAKLQKENERLQSEIQIEESQIKLNNQRSQFTDRLTEIEAGTQENMLQLAEVTRTETQIELEQKLKLNQLKYRDLWTLTASR